MTVVNVAPFGAGAGGGLDIISSGTLYCRFYRGIRYGLILTLDNMLLKDNLDKSMDLCCRRVCIEG